MIVIFRQSRSSAPSSTDSVSLSSLPEVKSTTRPFSSTVVDSELEFVSSSSSVSLASIPSLPESMASINTMDESKSNNISHAIAYSPGGSDMFARIMFYFRLHARAIVATAAFVSFVFVISMDTVHDAVGGEMTPQFLRGSRALYKNWGGAMHAGYFKPSDSVVDANTFRFVAVTDMDELSAVKDAKKPTFKSILLPGVINHDPDTKKYTIQFEKTRTLYSKHNEAGRGMELSELIIYQNRLLAFDDRTGSVFELLSKGKGTETIVVPRFVITEGDGDTDKGMKWEWASEKDGCLYLGSMGKEYTNSDGSIANTNNLWISIINNRGEITRKDWTKEYNFVRGQLGAESPGYIINEAVIWSEALHKWIFIPRRISSEKYNDEIDEKKGSNKIALVNEDFTMAKIVEIPFKTLDPLHGFSTIAFVPGTNERHALAIRTVEENCVGGDEDMCKQYTFFVIFDVLTGEVLMDEVKYDEEVKFEGVEFVNIYNSEPAAEE